MKRMKRELFIQPLAGAAVIGVVIALAGCSTFNSLRGNNQYGADKHMKHKVQDALKHDPLYKFPDVSVNVYRDKVQLGGIVHLKAQKQAAVNDAKSVPGVLSVQDNLTINTNPPVVPPH